MSTLNAGRQLIKAALKSGFTVAVHYESDDKPAITRSGVSPVSDAIVSLLDPNGQHLNDLWSEATACDDATVYILDNQSGHMFGWAYLIHGNDPEETVSDHSAKGWVNDWAEATDYGQREWKQ